MTQFETMPDEEVVLLAQREEGSEAVNYLLNKYKNFVRKRANRYFLVGADRDDIVQEGMIGLFKAIRDYRADRQASFHAFADICVTRQIITAIKTATRQKHVPLNNYVSLNRPLYDDDSERTLLDVIPQDAPANPEVMLINHEDLAHVEENLGYMFSAFEREVLKLYVRNKTYQQISEELHRGTKSVDNALQRIKKKLVRYVDGKD